MSSYKIKAKNKETGEIVTVCAIDDYFGNHNYGYSIEDPLNLPEEGYFFRPKSLVYSEEKFFQLYDRVEDKECKHLNKSLPVKYAGENHFICKDCGTLFTIEETPVEDTTPEWEKDVRAKFHVTKRVYRQEEKIDLTTTEDELVQFIRDTLKAERERIVGEMEKIGSTFVILGAQDEWWNGSNESIMLEDVKGYKDILKLIQNK